MSSPKRSIRWSKLPRKSCRQSKSHPRYYFDALLMPRFCAEAWYTTQGELRFKKLAIVWLTWITDTPNFGAQTTGLLATKCHGQPGYSSVNCIRPCILLTHQSQKSYNIWQPAARLEKLRRREMNRLVDLINDKIVGVNRDWSSSISWHVLQEAAVKRAGDKVSFVNYDKYVGHFKGHYCEDGVDESVVGWYPIMRQSTS